MEYIAHFREFSPFVSVNDQGEKTGYMINLLNILQIVDKINVTVIRSIEKFPGRKVNNSWNGLLGILLRNEGDFSLNPLWLLNDRFNDFPSSHPFLISRFQILYGTNQSNENDIYSVVDKWIIVVYFGAALLIYLTGILNSKHGKVKSKLPFMFLLQCLLGTSPQSLKCNGVSRFLSISWSLTSFILLTFISSEMTSQFSSKSEALPFDTVNDIFHFPNAKPLLVKNSADISLIEKNALTDKAFAEILKRANDNPDSCYKKLESIMTKGDIHSDIEKRETFYISVDILHWNMIRTRYAKTGSCKLKLSKPLMINYWVMYFKKNISKTLIKTVNKRLRQLTEGDCFEDLNPSLKNELHPCQSTETPDAFVVINVSAFMVIFRVCLFGFSTSLITLILEIYFDMLKCKTVHP